MIYGNDKSGIFSQNSRMIELPISRLWREVYISNIHRGNDNNEAKRSADLAITHFKEAIPNEY